MISMGLLGGSIDVIHVPQQWRGEFALESKDYILDDDGGVGGLNHTHA